MSIDTPEAVGSPCSGVGQPLCPTQTSSAGRPGHGRTVSGLVALFQGARGRNGGEEGDGRGISPHTCAEGTELFARHCQAAERVRACMAACLRAHVRACTLLSECSTGLVSGSMGPPVLLRDLVSGLSLFPSSFHPPHPRKKKNLDA